MYLMLMLNQVLPNYACLSKAKQRAIQLSYIVEITGHTIFTKSEATTTLSQIRDEGVLEFHITFAVEPILTAKQRRHNANELALFDLQTTWKGNKLPTNDLNRVNADFSSSNRVTVTDDRAQSRVDPDTAKLSPFQDVEDMISKISVMTMHLSLMSLHSVLLLPYAPALTFPNKVFRLMLY